MKKQLYFLLGILLAFSSLIISCDDNEQDSNICKITVINDGNGAVSITNYSGTSVNVLIGNQVEVVATPAVGCAFTGWYLSDGETLVSTEAKFIFTASENTILIARFTRLSNLVVRSAGYGSVSFKDFAEDSLAFLPGTEVTVVATPDKDCDFVGWYIGESDEPVSIDAEYIFTVPEKDITLTAIFSKRPVVTLRSNGYGSVSFKDSTEDSLAFLPGSEVSVVATHDADCDFIGWFVGDSETAVSAVVEYTFIVPEEDMTLTARFTPLPINGHEWVDLGLPSGIKWATCNVGATTPEEYGGYYAWGETEEKRNYKWTTYKWCRGSMYTITKYCTDYEYGTVDNKSNLASQDDVAQMEWGGSWRMPTRNEVQELDYYCYWKYTTQNGVKGYKVTGPNGNSIFLPAAGYRNGTSLYDSGSLGYYWSNSLYGVTSACCLNSDKKNLNQYWGSESRFLGLTVRPVSK